MVKAAFTTGHGQNGHKSSHFCLLPRSLPPKGSFPEPGAGWSMKLDTRLKLFVFLMAVFVVSLVVGDIVGGKLSEIKIGSYVSPVSVAMIPFPVTFLLTDLLNEFYGAKVARFVTWVGFFMALFAFALLFIAVALPWAPMTKAADWKGMNESSFNNIFSSSQRMLIASMVAYLVGQFSDIAVFHLLKRVTKNRMLWLRATGSTVVSQFIDTVAVQSIAWAGTMKTSDIMMIIITSYAIKLCVAIGLTPFIYAGHTFVERFLKIEPIVLNEKGETVNLEYFVGCTRGMASKEMWTEVQNI
jgi:queuosine precursor transporter